MSELTSHYAMLLGLDKAWRVADVHLATDLKRVEIALEPTGTPLVCPDCGKTAPGYDKGEQRSWRHLDTMQFETRITACVPRCKCPDCGVKTVAVPWAGKHSRFTLMFEAFAIEVMLACGNIKAASGLLNLDWNSADTIMKRAVDRGLVRRETDEVTRVGIDEKSFGKGQDYVSLMTDIDGGRVLEVVPGRDRESADTLWNTLPESQREQLEAIAMDMWRAFESSAKNNAPQADIVYDRFHVSKHLNEAVDKVRRKENKALQRLDDKTLAGTKQLWLFAPKNLSRKLRRTLNELKTLGLETGRAWAIKEALRKFWDYEYAGSARKYFEWWYGWAVRSRLKPIVEVAKRLKRHLEGLLNYVRHKVTNAMAEGFNSRVQHLKYSARGLRNFESYRRRILFFCGKLELMP
jgi:transposase